MMKSLHPTALYLLFATAALAACSGNETPRPAEFVSAAPAESDFGSLRVRYNALPTMSMSEAIAKQYGVRRDAGTALVVVALRELKDSDEQGVDGQVDAVAVDLSGATQKIALRAIDAGGYTDYIGTARVSPRNTYRFELTVRAGERSETVRFSRSF